MMRLRLILFALVISLGSIFPPTVNGLRILKMRETLLRILNIDQTAEPTEDRLYMEFCEQSSNTGNCVLAIDDYIINEWTQCASSQEENQGFWKAILEAPAYISRVVIHTVELPDAEFKNGLADFSVKASGTECFRYTSSEKFEMKSIPCDALADEIIIQSYLEKAMLALCEVEVFGKQVTFQGMESGEMELDFQACEMSTVEGESECNYAIDRNFEQYQGNYNKMCSQTEVEDFAWFVVYFNGPALVKHVKLYNRIDCCKNDHREFNLIVNEALCARHMDLRPFKTKIFKCERFGSSVKIAYQVTQTRLSLCQIQVFGHSMVVFRETKINYLGCFKDVESDPDFEVQVSATWMSSKKCRTMCKRINKVYFGLQNGQVCMCGNKHGKHGKAESEDLCSMPCKDNSDEMCGGVGVNSVYEIEL